MSFSLTVDGKRVFATTGGRPFDPARPVTIFVHGAGFDHTAWKLQARYFAWHGGSVLALDLPGHGRSEGAPLDSVPAMADWLTRVMDAAGAEQAALVGHSMGSLVALEAAARQPSRVRALALLGCAVPLRVSDVLLESSAANDHLALDLVNSWGYGRRAQFGGHRVPGLWMMRGGLRTLERAAPGVLNADLRACNDYAGGEQAAANVRCPTLLVIGERDMMTPAKLGLALAKRIEGAEVVTLPGVGHIMMEEAPDATLDALRRIL
jgi:pimeloyl-ACP methyl ester carboxylesterase